MGMSCDEMDKALHDVMTTIWKSYRAGAAEFNACFAGLHEKYGDDTAVESFINFMGFGLSPALARKANENFNK